MTELRHRLRTRLFVADPLAAGAELRLPAEAAHYLGRVLRLEPGAGLRLFNGRDGEWQAELVAIGRREAVLRAQALLRPQHPAAGPVLAFAPIRRQRLDWLLEKAVELGAGRLQPVITRFAQARELRADRAAALAREAAEQCERLDVPAVAAPQPLPAFLAAWPAEAPLLFCDEALAGHDREGGSGGEAGAGTAALLAVLRNRPAAAPPPALLVGPEGGFAPEERAAIRAHPAARALDLGPLILRAETAALAALALLAACGRPGQAG